MTPRQIAEIVTARFGDAITASFPDDKHPRVHANATDWPPLAEFLFREPSIKLDWLQNLSGVDYVADDKMCVVYDLWSFDTRHIFALTAHCPRENPHVPSVADLWPAAYWHEREAFDMFGIIFDGHPDLRLILCAYDWE